MVRWNDGFYGGLIAGLTSAVFYALVAMAWLREVTFAEFFGEIAQGVPGLRGAPITVPLVAFGVVLYFALAASFGIAYAALARRLSTMWQAPTSVLWGIVYGAVVWWVLNDVVVPLTGATNIQPLWEGLVGTIVFYGIVLSELTTVAHRRASRIALTPGPPEW